VVATLLRQLFLSCTADRIFFADNQAASDQEARVVVLHMRRPAFHKRDAMENVKAFLPQHQVREATVWDCFPASTKEVVRNLDRHGGHLRRTLGYLQWPNRDRLHRLRSYQWRDGAFAGQPGPQY
jgi:hypothetical protein